MLLFQACYLSCFPQGTAAENDFHRPVDKGPQPVDAPPPQPQTMGIPHAQVNYHMQQPYPGHLSTEQH